ncbi:Membrane-associated phospholipid phosphatase [Streptococcus sp. DD13]|nr:Membrane-associated phospholipid phosphatase [Streptococcus sp. DD13]
MGYVVRFFPQNLRGFDGPIQSAIRGDLPPMLTAFFSRITLLMNTQVVIVWVALILVYFAYRRWWSECLLLGGNLALTGILVVVLKNIYQRPRPSILHLVEEKGFSFPSGHALVSLLVLGSLMIIVGQRVKKESVKRMVQGLLLLFAATIIVSRVYVGVHYPSDVLGSVFLGFALLQFEFPSYDRLRFQWRFQSKQK